jgi:uncharacterized protein YbjT (DUF2867 family)
MSDAPVLVVGATGNVGPHLVKHLLGSGSQVRALVRDPGKAADLLGPEVEIVQGDLEDPASLTPALEGIEVASLATAPTPDLGRQEVNFIDAAEDAGVVRLVKLSGAGTGVVNDAIHLAHGESERRLQASGIRSVLVKPVVYMSNLLFDAETIKTGSLPSVFGDARVSFVDPRDVAELIARAILDPQYDDAVWEFGGPAALTHDEVAATLSEVLGRPIAHVRVDLPTFQASAADAGLPDFVVEAIGEAARLAPEGAFVSSDEVIRQILGRPGTGLRDWTEFNREALTA